MREREGGRKKDRIKIHVKMMKTAIYVDSSEYFFFQMESETIMKMCTHMFIFHSSAFVRSVSETTEMNKQPERMRGDHMDLI